MKDLIELEPLTGDHIFIAPRTEKLGNLVTPTLLGDLVWELRNSPITKPVIGGLAEASTVGVTTSLADLLPCV